MLPILSTLTKKQKLGVMGLCLFFGGILMQTTLTPAMMKMGTKQISALRKGGVIRKIWSKLPFPIEFRFYMFNVTNPREIDQGAQPIVQEVGPFIYEIWHEKVAQADRKSDDTVEYRVKNTYYYNKELSDPLTGDEEITVPNYFLLGLVSAIMKIRKSALPLIVKGLNSIYKKPSSIFMQAKVKDILFDGLTIDCNVTDTAGSAICSEVKNKWEEYHLYKFDEVTFAMSLIGWMNATDTIDHYRVKRGIKNIMEVGNVVEYNGKTNVSVWNDEFCDTFYGTDGTILHPFFDKKGRDTVDVFVASMCRSLFLRYKRKSRYSGISTLRYEVDIGTDMDKYPEQRCYCETPDACPDKGTYNLFKCAGLPLIVTNPHLMNVEPTIAETVAGLEPIKSKHTTMVDQEPQTGAILQAYIRAQFNFFIGKVEKFKIMKNLPDALLPLLWFDQIIILPRWIVRLIKIAYYFNKFQTLMNYSMMLAGLGLCGYAGYDYYRSRQVTKVTTSSGRSSAVEVLGKNNHRDNNDQNHMYEEEPVTPISNWTPAKHEVTRINVVSRNGRFFD
ncbi:hypothetical protein TKK_0005317 [Trichogramma kaykai]|uniref:Sensory neuron membrane protein 1 n=1 Tax=Trichogramma kaykai TaxID=54128 RepID=A0ABD2XJ70_9HYME